MNSPFNLNFVAFSEPGAKLHQQSCFADYISPPDPPTIISLKRADSPKPARRDLWVSITLADVGCCVESLEIGFFRGLIMRTGLSMDRILVSTLISPAVNYQVNFIIQYMKKGYKLVY